MYRSLTSIISFLLLVFFFILVSFFPIHEPRAGGNDNGQDCTYYRHPLLLPVDSAAYFPFSATCGGCHGKDSTNYALVNGDGVDVNMYDDWRAGIMANAAKDPFWKAKVRHEVLTNPGHSLDLQTKCTSCHAPMGHFTALFNGSDHYTLDDLKTDSLGMDGVSCGACHQIKNEKLGKIFSGNLIYDTSRVQYGPYDNPFFPPMANFVGFMPVYSTHVLDAGLCANCHTLITNTTDLNGEYTGNSFVEQASYHEWLNSDYATQNVSCQSCHLPQINEDVVISANYLFLSGRSPYGLHEMAGGNVHMLEIMKNFRDVLGIKAGEDLQNKAIKATKEMLQNKALQLSLDYYDTVEGKLHIRLFLKNLAGHKFPSGYPARRVFVSLILQDADLGDTLFFSGQMNDDFELLQENQDYEPHYDTLFFEDQVPIYELVIADVEGNVTTVLERADHALKDNRLPPVGFSSIHPAYDTTKIIGLALEDANFNFSLPAQVEGSGGDYLHYNLEIPGFTGRLTGKAMVYYQSIPPKWVKPLFSLDDSLINAFKMMYQEVKPAPVEVASVQFDTLEVDFPSVLVTDGLKEGSIQVFPNPFRHLLQWIQPDDLFISSLTILALDGEVIQKIINPQSGINLYLQPGIYYFLWDTSRGPYLEKVMSH